MMRNILWTAAAAGLIAGITACGSAQNSASAPASSPVTTPAAPVAQAVSTPSAQASFTPPPPPPDPCARFSAWASAGGQHEINRVNNDWTALQVDAGAGNAAAVGSDGRQLALDAIAALDRRSSPIASGLYKRAMRDMVRAGEDLEAGNYAAAEQINISSLINRLSAAIENQGCSF